jgi:glycosyltransferase involved in cell wall biosynthesis
MIRNNAMQLLAGAVRPLVRQFPELCFWFIGDGPDRETMHERLRGEGVRASISMPGSFSDIADVLAAADLYVQCDQQGLDFLLPAAVSSELPVVMADDPTARQWVSGSCAQLRPAAEDSMPVPDDQTADCLQWFDGQSASSLCLAIERAAGDWADSRRRAGELRRLLLRRQPLDQPIDQYARLIEQTMMGSGAPPIGAVS